MRLVSSMIFATALFGSAHADGDSLVDLLGPREIAVGEALRGGATGASAIGLNPSGLPLNQELVFEGGYGYRPTDQASLVNVSACDSTATLPGCFYYDYAGSSPDIGGIGMHRTVHIAGSSVAYPITPKISFGTSLKYLHYSTDVMGETSTSGFNFDMGATVRINELASIGLAGYNLWGTESPQWMRAAGGGLLVRPIQMLALSFDARWRLQNGDHSARYGGGAELFLSSSSGQQGYPIRFGVLHDSSIGTGTTYLSGGLGLAGMKFSLDLAARRAVSGGTDETMFIASMRIYGPRLGAGSSDTQ